MTYKVLGVYLVDFKTNNVGGEISEAFKNFFSFLNELDDMNYLRKV